MPKYQQNNYKVEILAEPQKTKKLGLMPSERFKMIEECLLVGSVPSYFLIIVLVIITSAFASIPWIAISSHIFISLLSVAIAFILLIKWVSVLQSVYTRVLSDRGNEEAIAMALGVACICVTLTGLIVLVAAHAGEISTPLLILLFVLPIMLIWQYRHIIFGAHEN